MLDKIVKIEKEQSQVIITLPNGDKLPTDAITTYTHYESGRKDCDVSVIKPVGMGGDSVQLGS